MKYPFFTLLSILLLPATLWAQLKAGFSMDKPAGCAPLAVAFTNTTTGASAAATYLWDFGNGNASVLRHPGALFQVGQTYTVTLTVTDGTQRSSASGTVTVYKKPEVDFTASASRGCAPFQVTFTSSSAAGSGTVGSYFWDFGDGTTMPASVSQVAHVYAAGVKQSVSLTVTNSYGCQSTKRTEDLVELLPVVKADFVSDKTFLCSIDEKVGFTNNSSGEGILSYSWDFGDGTTSTQKDPEHVFHKKGTFPVRLAVSSSLGCSDTVVRTAYLNVANFQSAVTAPAVICKGSEVVLKNGSTPRPTGSSWTIDGAPAGPVDTAGAIKHTFTTLGVHTIQLANQFGTCSDTTTSTVEVKGLPSLKGFIAEPQGICGAPVTVNFRDTTSGATAWGWNFERLSYPPDVQSTLQAPSKHFYGEGTYRVTLWVTDAAGCESSVEQEVNLRKPQAYIRATDNNGHDACDSLVKRFKMETEERLTSFTWHFSDGTTSKETEPEHVFKPGNHSVWLTFTNDKGCTNTTYYGLDIQAWTRP
ncbi:MAG TPA: PKD domain-containing protein, partial [Chitinophagaceae bacterium]